MNGIFNHMSVGQLAAAGFAGAQGIMVNPLYQWYARETAAVAEREAVHRDAMRRETERRETERREAEQREMTRRAEVETDAQVDELARLFAELTIGHNSSFERSLARMQTSMAERGDIQSRSSIAKAVERYEDNLSQLLQNFVAKARHMRALTGWWPSEKVEDAAVLLRSRLEGIEWQDVKPRNNYLRELDEAWLRKDLWTEGEGVFQVVWEFVGGIARKWDGCLFRKWELVKGKRGGKDRMDWVYKRIDKRYASCHSPKNKGHSTFYLPRLPSLVRQQKLFQRDEFVRYDREIRFRSDLRAPKPSEIRRF